LELSIFMELPLPLHLFIHFALAVLAGYLVGRHFKRPLVGIIGGVCGGFLIDFDHVLEYFLVFGPHFNLFMFFNGRQFLTSDLVRLWFHAWEYLPLLLIAAWCLRRRIVVFVFILALALGGTVHLVSDCLINHYPAKNYSLVYRAAHNFSNRELFSPEQYQKFLDDRQAIGF